MIVLNFIRGFCMAMADSVPGVSGGTIAFILGFYDDFLNSLNHILSKEGKSKQRAFAFLSKIGFGWIIGFTLSILFITAVFEKNIYEISSLFLGFIIASIPLIINSEIKTLKSNKRNIIFLFIGIALVAAINLFNPITSTGHTISIKTENLNIFFMIYIFLSGMIAISAMVLPGISGSTILLILGMYAPILNGVKQIIMFNFEYVPAIALFAVGILVGALVSVRGVRHLLKTHRGQTMYMIIGLMIGSIYAVIMGPTSLEIPKEAMNLETFNIMFFVIGSALIPILETVKKVSTNKSKI